VPEYVAPFGAGYSAAQIADGSYLRDAYITFTTTQVVKVSDPASRAKALLKSYLSPAQLKTLEDGGYFWVRDTIGRMWVVNMAQMPTRFVGRTGRHAYHVWPHGPGYGRLPVYDQMLAVLLVLRTCPNRIFATACYPQPPLYSSAPPGLDAYLAEEQDVG
jgi:hypothetical protein